MIDALQHQVVAALATLAAEYDDVIDHITAEIQPVNTVEPKKYETYMLLTVLRRAFVRAYQDG